MANSSVIARNNRRRSRKLRLEGLECRRLLAADMGLDRVDPVESSITSMDHGCGEVAEMPGTVMTDPSQTSEASIPIGAVVPASTGSLSGTKFLDINGNGIRDRNVLIGNPADVQLVIDVSGSTSEPFVGTPVGDVNGDGDANTILDAELAGFIALNEQIIALGLGNSANVSITVFGASASELDMDPSTPGVQISAKALSDTNGNGVPDVEDVLRSVNIAESGVGRNTNFEAALDQALNTFDVLGTAPGNGNLIFFSDGENQIGGGIDDEVAELAARQTNVLAFGIGNDSDLPELLEIDPAARIITSTDQLISLFTIQGSGGGQQGTFVEPGLPGVTIYLDDNNNGVLDSGERSTLTQSDNPATQNVDETGFYLFDNVPVGDHIVREVVPAGFEQTTPIDAAPASPQLYVHDDAGRLGIVDVNTGAARVIGDTGVILTDIAFDPAGNLFGLTVDDLYRINPNTAAVSLIGPHGIRAGNALVFGSDGTLYGAGAQSSLLFSINPATGAGTSLGFTGFQSSGDLAFVGDRLFLSSRNDELVEFELVPGIDETLIGLIGFDEVFGLATGDNGILYGVAGTQVFTVDTATGQGTLIADYGGQGLTRSFGSSFFAEAGATSGAYQVTVLPGDSVENLDFGNRQTGGGNPGGSLVVTNTNDSGVGSLRSAIEFANSTPNVSGPDFISFNIPGSGPHLIQVRSSLPTIIDPVVIDARSEPDYNGTPVVQIDGANSITDGLLVTSGGSTIAGLSVTGFVDAGVEFFGGDFNLATENYLGVDTTGGAADGSRFGIKVINSANNSIVDNVVSGNRDNGVFINGVAATGNTVDSNLIGTDSSGNLRVPNRRHGVALFAPDNFVSNNVISGNNGWGVFTRFATGGNNTIENNVIGLNSSGTSSVANAVGVQLRSPNNALVGNTISGNIQGVVIAGADSSGNTLTGNEIGTDPSGSVDIGNSVFGVVILNSRLNVIGGFGPDEGNLISGNGLDGVIIAGAGSTGNFVQANKIGVEATGSAALPNGGDGVRIVQRASNNVVRSNQISGNVRRGVAIDGPATSGNIVRSNLVGTDATATATVHNGNDVGILLRAPGNSIESNIISAVDTAIAAFSSFATDNVIAENAIGSHPALATPTGIHLLGGVQGTSVSGNVIANGQRGIVVSGTARRNDLSGNILFNNSQIAIDLGADGATANDSGDSDSGSNQLQNTPTVTSATVVGNDLQITYSVNTLPSSAPFPIRVEFFAALGGQAEVLLGTNTYSSPGSKTITLAGVLSTLLPGDQLTATATDADGNTSELSVGFSIVGIS